MSKSKFSITQGKGFQLTFRAGWRISVQFGPGNYADGMEGGRFGSFDAPARALSEGRCWTANTAEVAVFRPDGSMVQLLPGIEPVAGWATTEQVATAVAILGAIQPGEHQDAAVPALQAIFADEFDDD